MLKMAETSGREITTAGVHRHTQVDGGPGKVLGKRTLDWNLYENNFGAMLALVGEGDGDSREQPPGVLGDPLRETYEGVSKHSSGILLLMTQSQNRITSG